LAAQAFAEACSSLFGLGQIAFAFWASFIGNCICVLSQIFLYSYIIKASPRLTPYRLKGKKGVERLRTSYRLKNYGNYYYLENYVSLGSNNIYYYYEGIGLLHALDASSMFGFYW
jgi:hypothetical protein